MSCESHAATKAAETGDGVEIRSVGVGVQDDAIQRIDIVQHGGVVVQRSPVRVAQQLHRHVVVGVNSAGADDGVRQNGFDGCEEKKPHQDN